MTQFGGSRRLLRPQRMAGRRHVRPLPGRSRVGQRELAGVLRRLPPGPVPGPPQAPPSTPPTALGSDLRPPPAAGPAAGHRPGLRAPAPLPRGGTAPDGRAPTVLRGAASRIVANMEASLGVPTATSVRTVPARLLEVNRLILNNQLARTTGAKVSFTHIIGFAVVRALHDVPALNSAFVADADGTGKPGVVHHKHVGLGLAVDQEKSDGTRTLLVPCIRDADTLDFRSFVLAYEDLIRKIHTGKIAPDDFAGTTVSLTNPGTLGTMQSVPRLMPGQGAIIGVGALGYPAGFEAADPRVVAAARPGQGGDPHLHLRPPHHPRGRVRPVPGPGGRAADRSRRLLRRPLRIHGRALRAGALAAGHQRRPDRRRRAPAPGQAGPRADADQHVPGTRPPDRAPRPARRRAAAHPPRARPADLRTDHLGPARVTSSPTGWPVATSPPSTRSSTSCATRTAAPSASSTCTSRTPSRSAGSSSTSRASRRRSTWTSSATSSTASTPPRCSSGSSTPATSARSASASRAPSRPSCCSTPCSTRPPAPAWPRS